MAINNPNSWQQTQNPWGQQGGRMVQNPAGGNYSLNSLGGGQQPSYSPTPQPSWNMQPPSAPNATPTWTGSAMSSTPDWSSAFPQNQFSMGNFGEKNSPMSRYWENALPMAQFLQNTNQWQNEFNQGNQRYWDESMWGKQRDQFSMGLAGDQQAMARWQAQEAAKQWQAQFGREGTRDEREWDLANRQFGLQDYMGRGELDVSRQRANTEQTGVQNQYTLGREQNRIEDMYKRGQLSADQARVAMEQLQTQARWGRGGLEERGVALGERTQAELNAFRNAQMAQEAALAREQMAAQNQQAAMQAFGRTAMPSTRWLRSW